MVNDVKVHEIYQENANIRGIFDNRGSLIYNKSVNVINTRDSDTFKIIFGHEEYAEREVTENIVKY
jgi:metallophosphoesterase superfamily enzyme